MKPSYLFTLLFFCFCTSLRAQQVLSLYEGKIPNSKEAVGYNEVVRTDGGRDFIDKVSVPTLTIYLPRNAKSNCKAVIICPGGGYQTLAVSHEGVELANEFNKHGIAAFVLKYRLPNVAIMDDKTIAPLQDAQRAIQLVREKAGTWRINPNQIGILGASAGGHLASTAGTHFQKSLIDNPNNTSLRPDFMILMYPVISFGQFSHVGSVKNLLGPTPSAALMQSYSNETQVTTATPPTFLVHAGDDTVVPVRNSILFYEALIAAKVPAEMHLYPTGGHGFGLHNTTTTDYWFDRLIAWMK